MLSTIIAIFEEKLHVGNVKARDIARNAIIAWQEYSQVKLDST